ncbi:hypothetical protein Tco_0509781 [Tanacetum coccineum]
MRSGESLVVLWNLTNGANDIHFEHGGFPDFFGSLAPWSRCRMSPINLFDSFKPKQYELQGFQEQHADPQELQEQEEVAALGSSQFLLLEEAPEDRIVS